jgi:hypothetical protein
VSKEAYLIRDGKEVVVEGGMYEVSDAERVAQNAARREPGVRFTVCRIVSHWKFEPPCAPTPDV